MCEKALTSSCGVLEACAWTCWRCGTEALGCQLPLKLIFTSHCFKVVFPHQSAPHAGWEPDPLEVVRFLRMCPEASSLRYPDAKLPNVGTMKPKPPNSATFQGCNLPPLSTVSASAFYWFPHCLSQWFSTFLTLNSFSAVPHIVVTPNNKIIFVATT